MDEDPAQYQDDFFRAWFDRPLPLREAIEFHIEGMRLDGEVVPPPTTGWIIMGFLALFIASFAVGPGVVVWLTKNTSGAVLVITTLGRVLVQHRPNEFSRNLE